MARGSRRIGYPVITKEVLRVFISFATSHIYEAGFSTVGVLKTKYRSKFDVEREMIHIAPQFETLCRNKSANVSN